MYKSVEAIRMGSLHGSKNNLDELLSAKAVAESLLHALTWIKNQNFQNIDIEMNAKVIEDRLYNNFTGSSYLQVLIN